MNLIKMTFLIISTSFLLGCSSSARESAAKYVELVTSKTMEVDTRATMLFEIISDYDYSYLSDLSEVFLSKDLDTWHKYLNNSVYKYLEIIFFSRGLKERAKDEITFKRLVLEEIIKLEYTQFANSEYHETKSYSDSTQVVIYAVPIKIINSIQTRSIAMHTVQGESRVVLDMRIAMLNKARKSYYQRMRKADYYFLEKEVNKLLEELIVVAY